VAVETALQAFEIYQGSNQFTSILASGEVMWEDCLSGNHDCYQCLMRRLRYNPSPLNSATLIREFSFIVLAPQIQGLFYAHHPEIAYVLEFLKHFSCSPPLILLTLEFWPGQKDSRRVSLILLWLGNLGQAVKCFMFLFFWGW